MARIKVGMVSYGHSARTFHLPYLTSLPDDYVIHAFLQRNDHPDVRGKPGSSCEDDYPNATRYKTEETFLADEGIELVVIATMQDLHAGMAERALRAGKNVVVEKPFTISTEQADQVLAAQKASGKVLTVYQNRRYDSDYLTLKHLIDTDALGEIMEAEIHYDRYAYPPPQATGPTKTGEGMLFGLGSHTLDQALALFGKPASVTGFYRCLRGGDGKFDDSFTVILQYEGERKSLLVTVKTMMVSKMKNSLKYYVRGTKGSFMKYGEDQQPFEIIAGMSPLDPKHGVEAPEVYGDLTTSEQVHADQKKVAEGMWEGRFPSLKGDYIGYYKDVAKAVRGEIKVRVDPRESRDGIRVIELARESQESGKTMKFEG